MQQVQRRSWILVLWDMWYRLTTSTYSSAIPEEREKARRSKWISMFALLFIVINVLNTPFVLLLHDQRSTLRRLTKIV